MACFVRIVGLVAASGIGLGRAPTVHTSGCINAMLWQPARVNSFKAAYRVTAQDNVKANVIAITMESLSWAIMNTTMGRAQMPYFFNNLSARDDMFVFQNARTLSGDTAFAQPAILTGHMPFTNGGKDFVAKEGLASELKKHGYATASFSSYRTNWDGTKWASLSILLREDFDTVYDPKVTGSPLVCDHGMDDRVNINFFDKWLRDRNKTQPFYAQFAWNNNHFPHLVDPGYVGRTNLDRYLASMKIVDETLQMLFSALERAGVLENTIVMAAGDHGETPGLKYKRLHALDCPIMSIPMFIHAPSKILKNGDTRRARLRAQQLRLTSSIDLMPTVRGILRIGQRKYDPVPKQLGEVVSGWNLIGDKDARGLGISNNTTALTLVQDDRVITGGYVSYDGSNLFNIHSKDKALVINTNHRGGSKETGLFGGGSKVVEFKTDDACPVSCLHETKLGKLSTEERQRWASLIEGSEFPGLIEAIVPKYRQILNV